MRRLGGIGRAATTSCLHRSDVRCSLSDISGASDSLWANHSSLMDAEHHVTLSEMSNASDEVGLHWRYYSNPPLNASRSAEGHHTHIHTHTVHFLSIG